MSLSFKRPVSGKTKSREGRRNDRKQTERIKVVFCSTVASFLLLPTLELEACAFLLEKSTETVRWTETHTATDTREREAQTEKQTEEIVNNVHNLESGICPLVTMCYSWNIHHGPDEISRLFEMQKLRYFISLSALKCSPQCPPSP